jgi:hypothetical protein
MTVVGSRPPNLKGIMETKSMVRAISLFGLTALFLLASPPLRKDVLGVIGKGVFAMQLYAPISYVLGVILVLASMVIAFNRGSRAR